MRFLFTWLAWSFSEVREKVELQNKAIGQTEERISVNKKMDDDGVLDKDDELAQEFEKEPPGEPSMPSFPSLPPESPVPGEGPGFNGGAFEFPKN